MQNDHPIKTDQRPTQDFASSASGSSLVPKMGQPYGGPGSEAQEPVQLYGIARLERYD